MDAHQSSEKATSRTSRAIPPSNTPTRRYQQFYSYRLNSVQDTLLIEMLARTSPLTSPDDTGRPSPMASFLCAVLLLSEAATRSGPRRAPPPCASVPTFPIHIAVPNAPRDLITATERTCALILSDKLVRLVVASVVPVSGSATVLRADSALGIFRGPTAFAQLWAGGMVYALGAPVAIQDSSAYPYRGLMLDTARNYFPVSEINRTLDTLSWAHINTFHWPIVDSKGSLLVISGFTDIAQKGAYNVSAVYTSYVVANIVSYAMAPYYSAELAFSLTTGDRHAQTYLFHLQGPHPDIACSEATPVRISSDDAAAVVAKRFDFIHVASNSFCLVRRLTTSGEQQPRRQQRREPYKTRQNVRYLSLLIFRRHRIVWACTFDPLASLTAAQAPLVLGGQ
ncbi:hypothetical protein EDB89DRAFT_2233123 [Lactarius sanguifluus]|nr:hypothetical protein EDB89DRAFT_2233123 [Lactarius sanguifluus]